MQAREIGLIESDNIHKKKACQLFFLLFPRRLDIGPLQIGTLSLASIDKMFFNFFCRGVVANLQELVYLTTKVPHRSRSRPQEIENIRDVAEGISAGLEKEVVDSGDDNRPP